MYNYSSPTSLQTAERDFIVEVKSILLQLHAKDHITKPVMCNTTSHGSVQASLKKCQQSQKLYIFISGDISNTVNSLDETQIQSITLM